MPLKPRRRKPSSPPGLKLPATFVLVTDPDMPNDQLAPPYDWDGPFNAADFTVDGDVVTFWVDGSMPYSLIIDRQDGDRIVMKDGYSFRVEPWPLRLSS